MMRGGIRSLALVTLGLCTLGCFAEVPKWPYQNPPPGADGSPPDDGRPTDGRVPPADMGDGMVDGRIPDAGPTPPEQCNGADDDRDGITDEGFPVGDPCDAGQGACFAEGMLRCAGDGMGVVCGATPGRPSPELCNGIDDDCSGVVDEGFDGIDDDCIVGEGVCLTEGHLRCAGDGSAVECSVTPALERAGPEQCNGLDDDCDGQVDNGLIRGCDTEASGICQAGSSTCVNGGWSPCVSQLEPRFDVCNGLDDDCDNAADQNSLPQGSQPCPALACNRLGECALRDCIEVCDPDSDLGTICVFEPEDSCDGRDDDCNGVVDDNGICGPVMVDDCTLGLGWTTRDLPSPSPEWGDCDIERGGLDDDISCNGARAGAFSTISLEGDLDAADDRLGVAFRCDAGPIGDYIASHCRVFLGFSAPGAAVADGAAGWGPCPMMASGGDGGLACTSSSTDGQFLPIGLPFDLRADSLMAVAFKCTDAADASRAAAVQSSIRLSLGWADSAADDPVDWDAACNPLGDGDPYTACVTTRGNGRFQAMRLTADVGAGDEFAIRLEARR